MRTGPSSPPLLDSVAEQVITLTATAPVSLKPQVSDVARMPAAISLSAVAVRPELFQLLF